MVLFQAMLNLDMNIFMQMNLVLIFLKLFSMVYLYMSNFFT